MAHSRERRLRAAERVAGAHPADPIPGDLLPVELQGAAGELFAAIDSGDDSRAYAGPSSSTPTCRTPTDPSARPRPCSARSSASSASRSAHRPPLPPRSPRGPSSRSPSILRPPGPDSASC